MAYYRCKFVNDRGESFIRLVFVEKKADLKQLYSGSGSEKLVSAVRSYNLNLPFLKLFSRQVKYTDFLVFNQKLIILLRAGTSLVKALESILEDMKKSPLQAILEKAYGEIKNGVQISDALNSPQLPFSRIYRASLMAGERSGNLEKVLEQFIKYLDKVTRLRRKTVSSLSYPVILFSFMVLMVAVVMVFVIPRFSGFYVNFDAELPGITRFFIKSSFFLKQNFFLILGLIFLIYWAIRFLEKINPRIAVIDFCKLRVPFFGKIILENYMSVFSRTMAILIDGGIVVPEAAEIAVRVVQNRWLFQQIENIPSEIRGGRLLSDTLADIDVIPSIMTEVIRVGDSSGNLTQVLENSSDFFENSIDTKVNSIISLIEPIVIIVLGVVIAFMLLSIYLPIFSAVQVVR